MGRPARNRRFPNDFRCSSIRTPVAIANFFTLHSPFIRGLALLSPVRTQGRLSPLVEKVPLYLVLTEDTGERGALYYACRLLRD